MAVTFNTDGFHNYLTGMDYALTNPLTISIYQGVIPSTANNFVPGDHTSNLLVTWPSISNAIQNATITGGRKLQLSGIPISATATGTGTATWFALYTTSEAERAIIAEPSESGGDGMLQINNLSIATNDSITIYELNISFFYQP